jgi:hypothetical protein
MDSSPDRTGPQPLLTSIPQDPERVGGEEKGERGGTEEEKAEQGRQ